MKCLNFKLEGAADIAEPTFLNKMFLYINSPVGDTLSDNSTHNVTINSSISQYVKPIGGNLYNDSGYSSVVPPETGYMVNGDNRFVRFGTGVFKVEIPNKYTLTKIKYTDARTVTGRRWGIKLSELRGATLLTEVRLSNSMSEGFMSNLNNLLNLVNLELDGTNIVCTKNEIKLLAEYQISLGRGVDSGTTLRILMNDGLATYRLITFTTTGCTIKNSAQAVIATYNKSTSTWDESLWTS